MFAQLWLQGVDVAVWRNELGQVFAQGCDGADLLEVVRAAPSAKNCWSRLPPGVVVRGVLVEESHTCRDVFCIDSVEGEFAPRALHSANHWLQRVGLCGVPFVGVVGMFPANALLRLLQRVNCLKESRSFPEWKYLTDIVKHGDNVRGVLYRGNSCRDSVAHAWDKKGDRYVKYV